jgi:hypothetical protein
MVVIVGPDAVRRGVKDLALEDTEAELKDNIELAGPDGSDVARVETLEIKFVPDDGTFESISGGHLWGTVEAPERTGPVQEVAVVEPPEERAAKGTARGRRSSRKRATSVAQLGPGVGHHEHELRAFDCSSRSRHLARQASRHALSQRIAAKRSAGADQSWNPRGGRASRLS